MIVTFRIPARPTPRRPDRASHRSAAAPAARPTALPAGRPTGRPATRTAAALAALLVVSGATAVAASAASAVPAVAAGPAGTAAPAGLPTRASVGVPAGASLTPMAGGYVDVSDTTISNRVISGDVRFTGSNLTLRNVRVTGHAAFAGDDVVIEDSEFGSWALSGTDGVRAARVEVSGNAGEDGLHITSGTGAVRDVVITDTVIHSPQVTRDAHYDGIQVRGVDGLTLERVSVDLGSYKPQYNAALFLEQVSAGNRNITVKDSSFIGGGYVYYNGATNVFVTGTVFGGGAFGILYPGSPGFAKFTGNATPDGYALAYTGGDVVTTSQRASSPTPSPTPTPTSTSSPRPSPTPSPTPGSTPSPTSSPRPSPTPSPTPTATPAPIATPPAPAPAPEPEPEPAPAPAPAPSDGGTPSAGTTGTLAGTTLTPRAAGHVRDSGTTIADVVIEGDVTFLGDDLTLRNVRVTGTAIFRGDDVHVEDSEFGAVVLSGTQGATLTRVEVFGRSGRDGILVNSRVSTVTDVVIQDSWIHSPAVARGSRYEGIDVRGVDGLTLANVLVDLGEHHPEHVAALRLHDDNGGSRRVTVTGSQLLGGTHVIESEDADVTVVDSVLGGAARGFLEPGSTLAAFTGNTTPDGAPLTYSDGAVTP